MSEQVTLTIEAKVLGQRTPIVASWPVSMPNTGTSSGDDQHEVHRPLTLREVLTLVVTDEVAAFHQRQQDRRLPRIMAPAAIEQGAVSGKIDMGGRDPQAVSLDAAIAVALQAFEDHLYLVLLDGAPVETLETELALQEGSRLTFVRLVALVGG